MNKNILLGIGVICLIIFFCILFTHKNKNKMLNNREQNTIENFEQIKLKNANKNIKSNVKTPPRFRMIDYGGNNDTVEGYVWVTEPDINQSSDNYTRDIDFPELFDTGLEFDNPAHRIITKVPNIYGVSLANSGGGSRAFTSSVGYFRALVKMGYDTDLQYVSSVSGGSWFYGMFSCMQAPNYSVINSSRRGPPFTKQEILGASYGIDPSNSQGPPLPENLKYDDLTKLPVFPNISAAMLKTPIYPSDLVSGAFSGFSSHSWIDNLTEYFLKDFGLDNLILTLNKNHYDDLIKRNNTTPTDTPPVALDPSITSFVPCNIVLSNYPAYGGLSVKDKNYTSDQPIILSTSPDIWYYDNNNKIILATNTNFGLGYKFIDGTNIIVLTDIDKATSWNYTLGIIEPQTYKGNSIFTSSSTIKEGMNIILYKTDRNNKSSIWTFDPEENEKTDNPILKNSRGIIYLPDNHPFWICNATLFAKWGEGQEKNNYRTSNGYLSSYPYVSVQQTPLYTGIPQIIETTHNLKFPSKELKGYQNRLGGYVIESFAAGISFASSTDGQLKTIQNEPVKRSMQLKLKLGNRPYPDSYNYNLSTLPNGPRIGKGIPMPIFFQDFIGTSSDAKGGSNWHGEPALGDPDSIMGRITYYTALEGRNSWQYTVPIYNMWALYPEINAYNDNHCVSLLRTPVDTFLNKSGDSLDCVAAPGFKIDSCSFKIVSRGRTCTNNISETNSYEIFNSLENINLFNKNPYFDNLVQLSDGAFNDNTAVVSLCARGVRKIIAFYHQAKVIAAVGRYIPEEDDDETGSCGGMCDISHLFGVGQNHKNHYAQRTVKIFEKKEFKNVQSDLTDSLKAGGPCYSYRSLKVLPNRENGVAGNYIADVLFVVLQPSTRFMDTIPIDLNQQIEGAKITSNTQIVAKAKRFPNYKTVGQNGNFFGEYAGATTLTPFQINLLSTYTEWCLWQINPIVDNIFNDIIPGISKPDQPTDNTYNNKPFIAKIRLAGEEYQAAAEANNIKIITLPDKQNYYIRFKDYDSLVTNLNIPTTPYDISFIPTIFSVHIVNPYRYKISISILSNVDATLTQEIYNSSPLIYGIQKLHEDAYDYSPKDILFDYIDNDGSKYNQKYNILKISVSAYV